MKILKIITTDYKIIYININMITSYFFDNENTTVKTVDGCSFLIKGNTVKELTKLITSSTNGNLINLE